MFQPQQRVKHAINAVAVLMVLMFLFLGSKEYTPVTETTTGVASPSQIHDEIPKPEDCYIDLARLNSYGYDSVLYSRWEIAVERTNNFHNFSDQLDVPVPNFQNIDTISDSGRKPLDSCAPTTKIIAPMPPVVDASNILFGVSTSQERLNDSFATFSRWASGTKARLFVSVEPGPGADGLRQRAAELDIDMTLIESEQEVVDRYIALTRLLLQNRDAKSQWGVIMDDDTFFPSMSFLVKRLATYDASVAQYIGGVSENIDTIANMGYMGFGGAGIYLSMPMLEEMDKHHDKCSRFDDPYGDKRIAMCIYLHTTTKFTWDRDFHQLDFYQTDGSGFYESGRSLPLSLHHWKSPDWFPVDVIGMNKAASVCGDDCQLHRWRVGGSQNWFFVNGFSIIQHSYSIKDQIGMEATWDSSAWARKEGYAYSLGPFRRKDNGKRSLRLKEAIVDSPGSMRQLYMYDPEDGEPPYVIEVVWRVTKMAS